MRTTIRLDDDVFLAVQERARRERRSLGDVLSALAREALAGDRPDPAARPSARHGFHPLPRTGVPVTNALVNQLREEEGV